MNIKLLILGLFCVLTSCKSTMEKSATKSTEAKKETTKPNVVIIFLDDSGFADFSPFANETVPTPSVQSLAEEGSSFTNFYVPQAICSASRSALMSGSYPGRTRVFGAHGPGGGGLSTNFPTIAETFKAAGYKTGMYGKWHCGDQDGRRPHDRGFDETAGLMYSNDMWEFHPLKSEKFGKFPLQFWENGKVIDERVDIADQKQLTKQYTNYSVDFIKRHKDEPFLLYIPHSMPHVPVYCSPEFEGKSGKGVYGDVIMELDWSVGQITKALKENGLDENTIVIFSSDNGPWHSYGDHAGKTPFREAKATAFDGGTHSACIIKYPNVIKANHTNTNAIVSIDLYPTLAAVAGVQLPVNEIDGKNVWDLITDKENATNPHEYYATTTGPKLEAIMSSDGKWKLHLPHDYRHLVTPGKDGMEGPYEQKSIELSLFNLEKDPYETTNVIAQNPEIAEKLQNFAIAHKEKFPSRKKKNKKNKK